MSVSCSGCEGTYCECELERGGGCITVSRVSVRQGEEITSKADANTADARGGMCVRVRMCGFTRTSIDRNIGRDIIISF